jgi:hypothetical protein
MSTPISTLDNNGTLMLSRWNEEGKQVLNVRVNSQDKVLILDPTELMSAIEAEGFGGGTKTASKLYAVREILISYNSGTLKDSAKAMEKINRVFAEGREF